MNSSNSDGDKFDSLVNNFLEDMTTALNNGISPLEGVGESKKQRLYRTFEDRGSLLEAAFPVKEDLVIIADATKQTTMANDISLNENQPYFYNETTFVTGKNETETVIETSNDMREVNTNL